VLPEKKILMIFSVAPFPLRKNGTSLRYLPLIRSLNSRYNIDIVIISDDNEFVEGLGDYCSNYTVVKRPRKSRFSLLETVRMNISRIFPWTRPYSFEYYGTKKVRKNIIQSVDDDYDVVIWVQNYLTLLPDIKKALNIKKVLIDFIDSPFLLMKRQLAQVESYNLFQHYELWKMKRWEKKIRSQANQVVYISEIDAMSTGATIRHNNVNVVPNGVSIEDYTCETDISYSEKTIGYLGNMSYGPNVDAVLWIYNNLLTKLDDKLIKLVIIGKSPDQRVLKLAEDPRVIVTGMVENIWNYVNAIDVFVLPIFTGAGLKNKVLELMYAGKPVITTQIGNEGINAIDGEHLFICDTADKFIQRIELLLENENRCVEMGVSSRKFVATNFDWPVIINKYNAIVDRCLNN